MSEGTFRIRTAACCLSTVDVVGPLTTAAITSSSAITALTLTGTTSVTSPTVNATTTMTTPDITVGSVTYAGTGVVAFTPLLEDQGANEPVYVTLNTKGHYQVIGDLVYFNYQVQWSAKTAVTGAEEVTIRLPVSADITKSFINALTVGATTGVNPAAGDYITCSIDGARDTDFATLYTSFNDGTAGAPIIWNNLATAGVIQVAGSYFC